MCEVLLDLRSHPPDKIRAVCVALTTSKELTNYKTELFLKEGITMCWDTYCDIK